MDVSTVWDFCGELVGSIRPRNGYVPATVTRIDADGTVWVTTGDGMEAPASTCAAGVAVGDVVSVQWSGAQMGVVGNASDPAASMGTVRAVRKAAESAAKVASGAQAIADAIGQHFWADDNGAHVSTEKDNPTGERNILMNSLGILLRHGSSWLASFSDSAVAFYDGLGNAAANVVAQFGADGATIGYANGQHVSIDQDSLDIMNGGNVLATFGETAAIGRQRVAGSMAIYLGKSSSYNEGITEIIRWVDANSQHPYIRAIHDRNNGNDYVVIGGSNGTYPAYGDYAIVLGDFPTSASGPHGDYSIAEGYQSLASGAFSHAQNLATVAGSDAQTAIGKWNDNDSENAFEVGNGTADDARSNAFAVGWNGDLTYGGTLYGATWQTGTSGTTTGGVTTLPSAGTYVLVTGHNSTPALNGIWIVRTGGNAAFNIAGGGNVTVSVSGTTLTVTTTAGTVNVYYQLCGT